MREEGKGGGEEPQQGHGHLTGRGWRSEGSLGRARAGCRLPWVQAAQGTAVQQGHCCRQLRTEGRGPSSSGEETSRAYPTGNVPTVNGSAGWVLRPTGGAGVKQDSSDCSPRSLPFTENSWSRCGAWIPENKGRNPTP